MKNQVSVNFRLLANGKSIPVNTDVEQIEFSGHVDQEELIEFVRTLKPVKTFLIQGDLDQAQTLLERIKEYTVVQIPNQNESFKI